MRKTICVDLDGTILQYSGWKGVDHFENPFPGAKEFLTELNKFAEIIIFTCRCNPEINKPEKTNLLRNRVADYLDKHELPYDDIWIKEGKPIAHAYIDDRAVICKDGNYDGVIANVKGLL